MCDAAQGKTQAAIDQSSTHGHEQSEPVFHLAGLKPSEDGDESLGLGVRSKLDATAGPQGAQQFVDNPVRVMKGQKMEYAIRGSVPGTSQGKDQ